MSKQEKNAIVKATVKSNKRVEAANESAILPITASCLAGKEAGQREVKENQPGEARLGDQATTSAHKDYSQVCRMLPSEFQQSQFPFRFCRI